MHRDTFSSVYDRLVAATKTGDWDWPADIRTFLELRRRELEMIDQHWPIPEVDTVLEIGAGALVQAAMLSSRCRRYVAIDLLETHGMDLRRRAAFKGLVGIPNLWLAIARGEQVPLRSGTVDLVYSSNVFEHLEDQGRCASEIARVLRPGGYCILVVPVPWTRVNYFVEHYLLLFPNVVARSVRFWRKRLVRPIAQSATELGASTERLRSIREKSLPGLIWSEAIDMLKFKPHGEHYASVWAEFLDYRISKWKSLFPTAEFESVALFTDRLNVEWFGSRINLLLYRLLTPVNKRLGNKWPFYNFGHEIVFVFRRRGA